MFKLKKMLAGQVLLILIFAGVLGWLNTTTDLKLGLDLKGGTQLDYKIDMAEVDEADRSQIIEGVTEVIRRRVDSLGVSEPVIYTSNVADESHVIVELAGVEVEEAKETVGKTIQLEFREENSEPSDEQVIWATEAAQDFRNQLNSGNDFAELAEAATDGYELRDISWSSYEMQNISGFSQELQDTIKDAYIGQIIGPVEINEGYQYLNDQLIEAIGMNVIQVTDKTTETIENRSGEEVSANHILVAYEGAERSDATRSQEEALMLAEELLARIQGGEKLSDLAGEFSDDAGSGAKGGKLGGFGRDVMTPAFEEAAFALEVDGISDIVETEFGYHIIEVYDKEEGTLETETITSMAFNKIRFNTAPNPWSEEIAISGEHFKHADVYFSEAYQPYVQITFDKEGGELFEALTEANVGKRIAIFVGGDLISAPTVQDTIAGGNASITGDFSLEEAQDLARDLNTGAIPAPIELVGQYTISASLGAEALDQSLLAGLIGLLILGAYMLLYYRLPGLIADLALAIYSIVLIFLIKIALPTWAGLLISLGLFVYLVHLILKNKDSGGEKFVSLLLACVVLFFMAFVLSAKVTLTLAGIAGVVLSIGMAVDANILIFERIKEELMDGKSLDEAINDGFQRAWDSIRDSNFSSLITCAILFYFGTSIIRGFALNLALGILVSMFSAILLTRGFLKFAAETKLGKNLWLFGKPKTNKRSSFEFVKYSKVWAAVSGVVLTLAVVATAVFGLNLGLDFTGGTLMEVSFNETESEESTLDTPEAAAEEILLVEESLEADFGSANVVSTDQDSYLIRLKHISEEEHEALLTAFETRFGETEEIRFTTVGPTIGETLKRKAIVALVITLIMIVFYIAFAFRRIPKEVSPWRFGMTAIAALVHDVLIVLGVFVLLGHFLGVEIDALFITALLTTMGFSVHDTIVVFDRVRENLMYRKSEETLSETTNKALNQTLARSINTSISTLITIVALLILGAESIQMFVLALAIGILAGTYSSICVASPLLVWWNERANARANSE